MRADVNHVRAAFDLVGDHPKRGETRSYDAQTRTIETNDNRVREARIEPVPGTQEEFYLYLTEGKVEDRLTLTRKSLGRKIDEDGLYPALHAILGDPKGWPRQT
jgi:hypothetical protein